MKRKIGGHKAALTARIRFYEDQIARLRPFVPVAGDEGTIAGLQRLVAECERQYRQLDQLNPQHRNVEELVRTVLQGGMPDA